MTEQTLPQKIESLVSEPMLAAVKANSNMAMAQVKFMLDTCFTKKESAKESDPPVYAPVMIGMELTRGVITPGTPAVPKTADHEAVEAVPAGIQQVATSFSLPLLTIIPLNSLAVQTVDINIDLKNLFEAKDGESNKEATVTGSPAADQMYTQQCKLNLVAGQLPLPAGLLTIIQAFTSSIQPIATPNVS